MVIGFKKNEFEKTSEKYELGRSVMRFYRLLGGSVLKKSELGVCYEIFDFEV